MNTNLTPRQHEILGYVAKGMANKEIGKLLFISKRTVESHITSMFQITGLNNRTELTNWAITNKIVEIEEVKVF